MAERNVTEWILNKVVLERGLVKRYGRFVRTHVQAHRLQLLSVEVEDEGHARG